MNGKRGLVIGIAIVAASLSLHSTTLLYLIGPAGCIILIPALVIVLALPFLEPDRKVAPEDDLPVLVQNEDEAPTIAGSTTVTGLMYTAAQVQLSEELTADGTHRQSITITQRYPGEAPGRVLSPPPRQNRSARPVHQLPLLTAGRR